MEFYETVLKPPLVCPQSVCKVSSKLVVQFLRKRLSTNGRITRFIIRIQGDPNQNMLLQMAVTLVICKFVLMFVFSTHFGFTYMGSNISFWLYIWDQKFKLLFITTWKFSDFYRLQRTKTAILTILAALKSKFLAFFDICKCEIP